jgi:hypothetical protein
VDGAVAVWKINFDASKYLEARAEELLKEFRAD